MRKKAQVAIISLWVLVILTMLALSISHRVAIALRLSRYQRDRLKTYALAKAGINRAIAVILNDLDRSCDSLKDDWRDNELIFKEISFDAEKQEFATVSYIIDNGISKTRVFGVIDEESKINLNSAPLGLLSELFNQIGALHPEELAGNVYAWRGAVGAPAVDYQGLGYMNKAAEFSLPEELMLVKGITPDIFQALKGLVTVYGRDKININTASSEVLEILANYCVKDAAAVNFPADFASKVISLRQAGALRSLDDLSVILTEEQRGVLAKSAGFKSTCFSIACDGKIRANNFSRSIKSVFNREAGKIVYWYEN